MNNVDFNRLCNLALEGHGGKMQQEFAKIRRKSPAEEAKLDLAAQLKDTEDSAQQDVILAKMLYVQAVQSRNANDPNQQRAELSEENMGKYKDIMKNDAFRRLVTGNAESGMQTMTREDLLDAALDGDMTNALELFRAENQKDQQNRQSVPQNVPQNPTSGVVKRKGPRY